jgi:hypothetical protein
MKETDLIRLACRAGGATRSGTDAGRHVYLVTDNGPVHTAAEVLSFIEQDRNGSAIVLRV